MTVNDISINEHANHQEIHECSTEHARSYRRKSAKKAYLCDSTLHDNKVRVVDIQLDSLE